MLNATAILDEPETTTTAYAMPTKGSTIGPLGLEVGTGGSATFVYVQTRGNRGYPFAAYESSARVADEIAEPTVVENINRIRSALNPTVTDLASILKVSRQAIYDWQSGKPVSPENSARIAELARAADMFVAEGLRGTSRALRRPIKNGKTFFQLVADGTAADVAARALIEVLRKESLQREALRARFAGRKRPSRDVFEEMGAPMLDEKE